MENISSNNGQKSTALKFLNEAIAYNNKELLYYTEKTKVLKALEKYHEAYLTIAQAISLNKTDSSLWYEAGQLSLRTGDVPASISMLKQAIALEPQNLVYKHKLAIALVEENKFEESINIFKDILK